MLETVYIRAYTINSWYLFWYLFCVLKQPSLSLPGSPYTYRRDSRRDSKFSWGKKRPSPRGDRMPLVLPYLHNLDLPYADDSNAVTPTSEDLCNLQHTQQGALVFAGHRRRLSSTSYSSKMSQLESRFMPGSRRSSFASQRSRGPGEYQLTPRDRGNSNREPTHFQWNVSFRKKQPQAHTLFPEIVVDKTKSDDNVSLRYFFNILFVISYHSLFAYCMIFLVIFFIWI